MKQKAMRIVNVDEWRIDRWLAGGSGIGLQVRRLLKKNLTKNYSALR